jgi:hypothetical protein
MYCSAHYDHVYCSYVAFWLHGIVGADLRPDIMINQHLECGVLGGGQFDPHENQFSIGQLSAEENRPWTLGSSYARSRKQRGCQGKP